MYKCKRCNGLTKTSLTEDGLCFKCMMLDITDNHTVTISKSKKEEWIERETYKIRNDW